jgi:hypothetical protein
VVFGIVIIAIVTFGAGVAIGFIRCEQQYTKAGTPSASHNKAMLKLPAFRDIYDRIPLEEHRGYAIDFYCELCRQLQQ